MSINFSAFIWKTYFLSIHSPKIHEDKAYNSCLEDKKFTFLFPFQQKLRAPLSVSCCNENTKRSTSKTDSVTHWAIQDWAVTQLHITCNAGQHWYNRDTQTGIWISKWTGRWKRKCTHRLAPKKVSKNLLLHYTPLYFNKIRSSRPRIWILY